MLRTRPRSLSCPPSSDPPAYVRMSQDFIRLSRQKRNAFQFIQPGTYVSLQQHFRHRDFDDSSITNLERAVIKYYKIDRTIGLLVSRTGAHCQVLRLDLNGKYVMHNGVWVGYLCHLAPTRFAEAEKSVKEKGAHFRKIRNAALDKIAQVHADCAHDKGYRAVNIGTSEVVSCKGCGMVLVSKFAVASKKHIHVFCPEWYEREKENLMLGSGEKSIIRPPEPPPLVRPRRRRRGGGFEEDEDEDDDFDERYGRKEYALSEILFLYENETLSKSEGALAAFRI